MPPEPYGPVRELLRVSADVGDDALVHVVIDGYELPGRSFCDAGGGLLHDVRVGVQIRNQPEGIVSGDSPSARWELDVSVVVDAHGDIDFRGPAVHGKRGERFLYLTWGNVTEHGHFEMFRRAKLMLNRVDPELVHAADSPPNALVGTIRLSDRHGGPRCARVDPPDLVWSLSSTATS